MLRTFRFHTIAFMLAMAVLTVPAYAADTLPQGLKVGDSIPQGFTAIDQDGKPRDFPSIGGKRGTILLFTRSLSW